MTDRYWIGVVIVLCLVVPEHAFWWFPGLMVAFLVGRWSKG